MKAVFPAIGGLCVGLLASPALAAPVCTFTEECYMSLGCEPTDWELTVDHKAGRIMTIAETLDILHVEDGQAQQIVARGPGALHLLTIGTNTALYTLHIGAGPASVTYFGTCGDE
ncbi:hypothetical protein [Maritimibacter sp. HL-12]|jgi:hypothetical protein|uniref:hypothetical protein n=1 Tax=Maritimibacter sp. HL-12 TaxID=1162418 RepID=UPI000A0F22F8|nr:hypothetical protein [Maritimibacter sp. HL-12]SMH55655.1 hypothetical protein SAMN05661107_3117 [Maritimibacter sp. HL-12]